MQIRIHSDLQNQNLIPPVIHMHATFWVTLLQAKRQRSNFFCEACFFAVQLNLFSHTALNILYFHLFLCTFFCVSRSEDLCGKWDNQVPLSKIQMLPFPCWTLFSHRRDITALMFKAPGLKILLKFLNAQVTDCLLMTFIGNDCTVTNFSNKQSRFYISKWFLPFSN